MNRLQVAVLSLSAAGLIGIATHEKFMPVAYDDGVGVQTIGYGTTQGVRPGDRITPDRALIRLGDDVSQMERQLRQCIGNVQLFQHEWDAIVSWTYNVGATAACNSTLVKKLHAGDYAGACNELPRWVYAKGQRLRGLEIRREQERRQCLGLG